MTCYIALLRAVNVGGTGKLPMTELRAMCARAGLHGARTYIASGNVLVESDGPASHVQQALASELASYAGRAVDVLVRDARQMQTIAERQPFTDVPGNRVAVLFLDRPAAKDLISQVRGLQDEQLVVAGTEIYAYYPSGMADSRWRLPSGVISTARNMNTVARLVAMAKSQAAENGKS
ncbi:DUF1697 domain-containing protein [Oleiagrimonas sp. C23AA]|uniref:DUF1697 domain-containing protein n=1 Tax=Oleiagrimonas sp. C23AA TaxID=2719047 RepID=UPI0014241068|nr:DUF1697 domain-containing protein [Oleiagrimonas sp. C23AA]NII09713.1 DUF1697 domain-containing protein [Oleiagrimonas sp. C23AA]